MAPGTKTESQELTYLRTRIGLLKQMATHVNSGLDPQQVIESTLLEAHKLLPHLRISFSTLNDQGVLRVGHSVAPLSMAALAGQEFDVGETRELARLLSAGKVFAIRDIETDGGPPGIADFMRRVSTHSLLAVRVRHPDHQLAALSFAKATPHEWSHQEKDMITDIADYLAIAIRESEMLREQQQATARLQEAQRMEAVGRLVGGVAHDFNNILTGMMIYTGLLHSALGKGSPLQRHVREIQNAGERGATLIGQLLSMSRRHVLETRLMSLNDIVAKIREMLQRLVGEDVLVECHLAGDLPDTRLDENQIRQCVLNLAVNARDAMKQGGRLILSTRSVTADASLVHRVPGLRPGDYVALEVADTGSGMSAEALQHCFEPFFTTKPSGEGTGLGLSTVFGAVQQHGGTVTAASAQGQGTTFELYFPVTQDGLGEAAPRRAEPREKHTVLLVEDEAMLRLPLRERLSEEGYQVLSAANPEGGLEMAQRFEGAIHLLITDLVMPGMNGQEMAERMESQRPEMKVLFMSGYTDEPRARRLIAHGANFLRKPFDSQQFVRKVTELLDQSELARTGQARLQKNPSILGKET